MNIYLQAGLLIGVLLQLVTLGSAANPFPAGVISENGRMLVCKSAQTYDNAIVLIAAESRPFQGLGGEVAIYRRSKSDDNYQRIWEQKSADPNGFNPSIEDIAIGRNGQIVTVGSFDNLPSVAKKIDKDGRVVKTVNIENGVGQPLLVRCIKARDDDFLVIGNNGSEGFATLLNANFTASWTTGLRPKEGDGILMRDVIFLPEKNVFVICGTKGKFSKFGAITEGSPETIVWVLDYDGSLRKELSFPGMSAGIGQTGKTILIYRYDPPTKNMSISYFLSSLDLDFGKLADLPLTEIDSSGISPVYRAHFTTDNNGIWLTGQGARFLTTKHFNIEGRELSKTLNERKTASAPQVPLFYMDGKPYVVSSLVGEIKPKSPITNEIVIESLPEEK